MFWEKSMPIWEKSHNRIISSLNYEFVVITPWKMFTSSINIVGFGFYRTIGFDVSNLLP